MSTRSPIDRLVEGIDSLVEGILDAPARICELFRRLRRHTNTARGPYAAVIAEADCARGDARRAAGFRENVGLERLQEAIDAAEANDDRELAVRGRDALAVYERWDGDAMSGPEGDCDSDLRSVESAGRNPP